MHRCSGSSRHSSSWCTGALYQEQLVHRCSGSSRHSSSWCTGAPDHPVTTAAGARRSGSSRHNSSWRTGALDQQQLAHRRSGSSRHSSRWFSIRTSISYNLLGFSGILQELCLKCNCVKGWKKIAQALWIIQAQQQLVQHKDFNQLRFTGIQWNIARIVLKVQLCQGLEGNRSHPLIPF